MENKNYQNMSLVDVAYDVLLNHEGNMSFVDLYNEACALSGLDEMRKAELISGFFTNLSLDGRFVTLKNNEWTLRSRVTFDKVHVDLNAIYEDIEIGDRDTSSIDLEDEDEKILHMGNDEDEEDEDESEKYDDDSSSEESFY